MIFVIEFYHNIPSLQFFKELLDFYKPWLIFREIYSL